MSPIRIHYLQHVPFEGLGCIEAWALQNGITLTCTRLYEKVWFPQPDHFDWLIIMGGPMGVYDYAQFTWLIEETAFLRQSLDEGKTIIGVCLGAQLIASALGSRVYPAPEKEIGWFDVTKTTSGKSCPLVAGISETIKVLHWHGDTFDLPNGAVHLFSSKACANQAFLFGDRVLGLQFHFELMEANLLKLIENCRYELTDGPFIQPEHVMLANTAHLVFCNQMLFTILNRLLKG